MASNQVVIKKEDPDDDLPLNNINNNRSSRPTVNVKTEPSDAAAPSKSKTTYRDFPIFSSAPTEALSHIMRFDSHLQIDPSSSTQFIHPLKLNRKREPRLKQKDPQGGEIVLDRWGKQLLEEAKPMIWPRDPKELQRIEAQLKAMDDRKSKLADESLIAPGALRNSKKNAFQKKTKEVHKASTAARRVHNMEYHPWVLEDDETSQNWESAIAPPKAGIDALREAYKNGKLKEMVDARVSEAAASANGLASEGGKPKFEKADTSDSIMRTEESRGENPWIGKLEGEAENAASGYALFVFDDRSSGAFKLVPVSRQYKFMQKPKHSKLTADEAEKQFEKAQKAGMSRWAARPDAPGSGGKVKSEKVDPSSSPMALPTGGSSRDRLRQTLAWVSASPGSRGGGRKLMAVRGRDRGGSDDEGKRRRNDDDTFGELDFEEDWADDEERMEGDNALDEEEAKELEDKVKREMAKAERSSDDEDEEENEDDQVNGTKKQLKKMMKALGKATGNDAYESDEDKNPYLSESDEDSDMEAITNPEKALAKAREAREQREREAAKEAAANAKLQNSRSGAGTPGNDKSSKPSASSTSNPVKKHGSHAPGAGHASVAHRATSPSRTTGPRPSGGSASASKSGSRSSSPTADAAPSSTGQKRKSTSATTGGDSSKRVKTGDGSGSGSNSPNRANSPLGSPRAGSPVQRVPANDIERSLIQLVRDGEAATIKECLAFFSQRLKKGEISKDDFTAAFGKVLSVDKTNKTLKVKDGY